MTEQQFEKLNELIDEGFAVKTNTLEGKKNFLKSVQVFVGNTYTENGKDVPLWVYLILVKPITIGNNIPQADEKTFVDKQINDCLDHLLDMRSRHNDNLLTEINLRLAEESTKQSLYAKRANVYAVIAAIISFLSFIVSIIALNKIN
ncbi:hypothetical protein M1D30_12815 [Prevotella sp. E15-22]|uniref:hypothetical protein n=1 Tax=Prevotella sp. E15-22 TaxID=2937774 RepID=UPI002059D048|nr:hypothetical protein [Prevotella sp. E15-22]UPS44425.1 hypothetical protein M1D30_12815 [Prevotella sp. E15-22]